MLPSNVTGLDESCLSFYSAGHGRFGSQAARLLGLKSPTQPIRWNKCYMEIVSSAQVHKVHTQMLPQSPSLCPCLSTADICVLRPVSTLKEQEWKSEQLLVWIFDAPIALLLVHGPIVPFP